MARILKLLTGLAVVAALGWVAWWFIGARTQEAALAGWFRDRAAEGWQAEFAELVVTGFPDRFVRRIEAPALADPEAGWAWSAPELVFDSPAVDPTRVEVRFPPEQVFALPGERARIQSETMKALLALSPGVDLRLIEGSATLRALAVEGQAGWRARAGAIDLALIRRDGTGDPQNTHELRLDATAVELPKALVARIDPSGLLDPRVEALRLDALVLPDRPLDRHVIEDGQFGLRTLVLRRAALEWDGMGLEARGRLDADAEGRAEGKIDLSLRDWRRLLALSKSSGALGDGIADAVGAALELVALLNRSETLDVTLRFEGGAMRVGPIPVGEAPRLLPG